MSEDLLSEAATLQDEYLNLLEEAVERESPSGDVERIQEVASFFTSQFEARGAEVELIEAPEAGVHLLARIPGEESGGKPLLVLGHMDTVHPVGTFGETPFTIDGEKVRGPGVAIPKNSATGSLKKDWVGPTTRPEASTSMPS